MKTVYPKPLTAAQKAKRAEHAERMTKRKETITCKYCRNPVKIGKIDRHEAEVCPSRPQ